MREKLEAFSNLFIIFAVYSFLGWIYEVLWMWFVVPPYHFINRGVLFGPFLPIYGFGMIILLLCLNHFMKKKHPIDNPYYQFVTTTTILTFFYTTIIEYTTKPKITHVYYYLQHYGLGLFIVNVIGLLLVSIYIKNTKKEKIKKKDTTIILVFLAIWIIATLIEYVSHFAIDKISHKLLWDYTKDFLNINARVNWDASRNFAIGGNILAICRTTIIELYH
ncbi:MAG: putative ABC transporter permease [Bacilli bacterium]|nr:putative ABC transporter permease [Bacilli bacterium]